MLTSYSVVVRHLKHFARFNWVANWLAYVFDLFRHIFNVQTTIVVVMGKCKFSDSWVQDPEFKDGLRPVVGNNRQAYCSVCKKNINVNWMGANALRSHMQSTKHKNGIRGRREQLILPLCQLSVLLHHHRKLVPRYKPTLRLQQLRLTSGGLWAPHQHGSRLD